MQKDLVTVEDLRADDPDQLIGAVYVPRKTSRDAAIAIGRAIVKALGMDAVLASFQDRYGNTVEIMRVNRR